MKKFFAVLVVALFATVASNAQFVAGQQTANAVVNVNVARLAGVVFFGFSGNGLPSQPASSVAPTAVSNNQGNIWVTVGQAKQLNAGTGAGPATQAGPGYVTFNVYGEPGSFLTVTTSSSAVGAPATFTVTGETWEMTTYAAGGNGAAAANWAAATTGANAGTQLSGTVPASYSVSNNYGFRLLRYNATITGVAPGAGTLTPMVSLSNYVI